MKLIIANSRTEEMVGDLSRLSERARQAGAWGAQRMLWFATDWDVVVLPWLPPPAYLDYVTGLTRTDPATLSLLVPRAGELGSALLTPDRLADTALHEELRAVLKDRPVQRVVTCFDDYSVIDLVEAVGVEAALPGHAFSAQGGVGLVNSKAVFRAVAAGAGVRIAPGVVTHQRQHAIRAITDFLAAGHPVMVKQEYAGGGFGNAILAPKPGVQAAGATDVTVLSGPSEVDAHVAQSWDWMTGGRDRRVVIERYYTDCATVYAEFEVTDHASELSGTGQILMEPVAAGEIVPPPTLTPGHRSELAREGAKLSEIFRGLGYRGRLSADAVATPEGELRFTETNGRVTGSTHLHTIIRARMLGEWADERTLLERDAWAVPSFETAVATLRSTGLGFDPSRGTGVVITANYVPVTGAVMYCVVAENLAVAESLERRLHELRVGPA